MSKDEKDTDLAERMRNDFHSSMLMNSPKQIEGKVLTSKLIDIISASLQTFLFNFVYKMNIDTSQTFEAFKLNGTKVEFRPIESAKKPVKAKTTYRSFVLSA